MPQLLLELFSEEIPARMQGNAARDLARMAGDQLKAAGFPDAKITTYAGPRRLTMVVDDLPAATPDIDEELKGPRTSAPPQALEGFLRKTGLTQDQLEDRDGVWFARISQKGKKTADVIAPMVDHIVRNFPWPKSMKWGTCALRWVRPLQSILCIFDGRTVEFEIEGIRSGDTTHGHRFMGSGEELAVGDFDAYHRALADNYVILDVEDRKARILDGAQKVCAAQGLELVDDPGLLEEVAGLAEWPVPILGDMEPAFLELPPEVIRTSMRTHQKYFAVKDPISGKLAAQFVVVANIEAKDGGHAIAAGNARVLSARLSDAQFFWNEDNKAGNFEKWLEKLKGVTFHAKLGTMAERVERIAALAREIAPLVGSDADTAEKAARLAKADLASEMVGEFPELQGVMGGYYAEAANMPADIAAAIRDHYKPQGPSDAVPTQPLAAAVAMADKLDMLIGFFAIDEKPTGSKDPYALRRAALGLIRIILEFRARIPLVRIAVKAERGEAAIGDLKRFLADRMEVALTDGGSRQDLVRAVLMVGDSDLVRLVARLEALDGFVRTDDGSNLLAGYKRAANILKAEEKKGELPEGNPVALPGAPAEETALLGALNHVMPEVHGALMHEDFAAAMASLATLRAPVDDFFEGVMVNSEVPEERENRLRLLIQVRDLMGRVADFSQIAG